MDADCDAPICESSSAVLELELYLRALEASAGASDTTEPRPLGAAPCGDPPSCSPPPHYRNIDALSPSWSSLEATLRDGVEEACGELGGDAPLDVSTASLLAWLPPPPRPHQQQQGRLSLSPPRGDEPSPSSDPTPLLYPFFPGTSIPWLPPSLDDAPLGGVTEAAKLPSPRADPPRAAAAGRRPPPDGGGCGTALRWQLPDEAACCSGRARGDPDGEHPFLLEGGDFEAGAPLLGRRPRQSSVGHESFENGDGRCSEGHRGDFGQGDWRLPGASPRRNAAPARGAPLALDAAGEWSGGGGGARDFDSGARPPLPCCSLDWPGGPPPGWPLQTAGRVPAAFAAAASGAAAPTSAAVAAPPPDAACGDDGASLGRLGAASIRRMFPELFSDAPSVEHARESACTSTLRDHAWGAPKENVAPPAALPAAGGGDLARSLSEEIRRLASPPARLPTVCRPVCEPGGLTEDVRRLTALTDVGSVAAPDLIRAAAGGRRA